jgi:hypothetical protein
MRFRISHLSILVGAAALFFALTFALGRPPGDIWNSPDETANAFWASRLAAGGPLAVHDVVVGLGRGEIHPRSMAVVGDSLVPGSFPGLIVIFGLLKVLLRLPLAAMTPLFTVLAGFLVYALVRRHFDARAGFWTALLFYAHPAILYYAARGLFHNLLFLDLLIVAAAFFALRPFKGFFGRREILDDVFGGFIFGWAMVTRASEAVWAIPAFAAFLPFVGPERWRRLGFAALGAALPLLFLLQFNAGLFGSPFRTAYVVPSVAVEAPAPTEEVPAQAGKTLLPFGFHPRLVLKNAFSYGLALFWWFSLLSLAGFALWARGWKGAPAPQKVYAGAALAVAAWLAILYGSWEVKDRLDHESVTIGTSYVRYFLPIYIAALPFAGSALARLGEAVPASRRRFLPAAALLLAAALSLRAAAFAGDESLLAVRETMRTNLGKRAALAALVPDGAVVITERFDKVLFPRVHRVIPRDDEASFAVASELANYAPVYWYGLDPSAGELDALVERAWRNGLTPYIQDEAIEGETLFRLYPFIEEEEEVDSL